MSVTCPVRKLAPRPINIPVEDRDVYSNREVQSSRVLQRMSYAVVVLLAVALHGEQTYVQITSYLAAG